MGDIVFQRLGEREDLITVNAYNSVHWACQLSINIYLRDPIMTHNFFILINYIIQNSQADTVITKNTIMLKLTKMHEQKWFWLILPVVFFSESSKLLDVSRCPKIRVGTYIFSDLCSITGIPFPLFHTLILFASLKYITIYNCVFFINFQTEIKAKILDSFYYNGCDKSQLYHEDGNNLSTFHYNIHLTFL